MAKRKKTPDILSDRPRNRRGTQKSVENAAKKTTGRREPQRDTLVQPIVRPSDDLVASIFPQAEKSPLPLPVKVRLAVTASKSLAGELERYISQEFQTLDDAALVTEEPKWTLVILGVELRIPKGEVYGVALSVIVVQACGTAPASEDGLFRGTWLRVGTRIQLQHLCQGIVAEFNRKYVVEQRKAHQL